MTLTQKKLEIINELISTKQLWIQVTQFDKKGDVLGMAHIYKKHDPTGDIKYVVNNRAFFRPANDTDYVYITEHNTSWDIRGREYADRFYYQDPQDSRHVISIKGLFEKK